MRRASRSLRLSLIIVVAFAAGWLAGQLGPWHALAQEQAHPGFTNLLGHELKVRKVGEANFTDESKKVAFELYRDEANQNLIYVTDTGAIAVVPVHTSK